MDMPDGWEKLPFIQDGWKKGEHRVYPPLGKEARRRASTQWPEWVYPPLGKEGYVWIDAGVGVLNGGFPDSVSCAVACELATGGCTDGHA